MKRCAGNLSGPAEPCKCSNPPADTKNSVIRAVLPDSTIVLVAGTYAAGYSTGAGVATAAQLDQPWQVRKKWGDRWAGQLRDDDRES